MSLVCIRCDGEKRISTATDGRIDCHCVKGGKVDLVPALTLKKPTALDQAKALRKGESLSFCDSILSFKDGRLQESYMSIGYDGHQFVDATLGWKTVKSYLKSGSYH